MLLRRLILVPLLPLTLAACEGAGLNLPGFGNRTPEAAAPVQEGPPAVSPLEQPIETGAGRPVGTANAETVNVVAFAADAPGWSAVVDGKAAALARDGARTIRIPVRRIDFGSGVEFAGSIGNQAFSMTVRADDCADGSPMSASARVGGKSLAPGCARPATAEQVAQIAKAAPAPAPKSAPKPKPVPAAAPKAAAPATPMPTPPSVTTTTPTPTTPTTPTTTQTTPTTTTTPDAPASTTPAPSTTPTTTPTPTSPTVVIPGGPTSLPPVVVVPPAPATTPSTTSTTSTTGTAAGATPTATPTTP